MAMILNYTRCPINNSILESKKFITACIAAVTQLLTFCVANFGLNLDVEKTITIMTALITPFLIYIGAEGYSEAAAKAVIEEGKSRKAITDQVLDGIVNKVTPPPKDPT